MTIPSESPRLWLACLLAVPLAGQEDVAAWKAKLRDKDPAARIAAAGRLAQLGAKAAPAAPELGLMLGDTDRTVADAAATALGKIGKPAFAVIRKGLQEKASARAALGAMEAAGAEAGELVPDLLAVFRQFEDIDNSKAAARAIKAIGAPALPGLRQGMKVRVTSCYAAEFTRELKALAAPAIPELMALVANRGELTMSRTNAAAAIGEIGKAARSQSPKLIEYSLDEKEDASLREATLRAVGAIGTDDPKVKDGVRSLLAAKDPRLASFAKSVLEQLK